jgi:hypothetical protein
VKHLRIAGYVILGLLLVPPLLFLAFYFAAGGPKADTSHPPAILIPYLYLYFGLRFAAPAAAAALLVAAGFAFSLASVAAWLHQFR